MPTTTRTRKRQGSSRPSGKAADRSGRARRGRPRRGGPGAAARLTRWVKTSLGDQRDDVYGVGLVLVGVLAGLGMYAGQAGVVGATVDALMRGLFGVVGYAVPPLLVYAGSQLVIDGAAKERGRRAIGVALLAAAVLAAWHLSRGVPPPTGGYRALWSAGGLVGWALARPLQLAVGMWGAAAVCAATGLLGGLIFTKTPVHAVGRKTVRTGRWVRDRVSDVAREARSGRGHTVDVTVSDAPSGADDQAPDDVVERAVLKLTEDTTSGADLADADPTAPTTPPATAQSDAPPQTRPRRATPIEPPRDGWESYLLPPLDLLRSGKAASQAAAHRHVQAQARALQHTFEQFGVDAVVARTSRGPTVTRFEVELGPGVQVRKVVGLGDDIAYALAAPDVRIVAPIPGKSAIGVEVPNRDRDLITLRDILDSDEARRDPHPMRVAFGVDIAGQPALANLTTMPHLLISGATGAGKSVTLNAMIASVVLRARPDQVRMILVDPKRVELNHYEGAPHLLSPVITDPKRAAMSLEWVVKEMEQRYETLAHLGFRNIDAYNDAVAAGALADGPTPGSGAQAANHRHMPYILVVIDELADLMLVAPRDVEEAICRIAQMARAVGIHLVIATQRPSVDVITGLIKANIPSRLALAVASQTDSRTILDQAGAEKLVGLGDMLFLPSNQGKPARLQGCFVSEAEIDAVVEFCKTQRHADYVDGVQQGATVDVDDVDLSEVSADDDDEVLVLKAMDLVVRSGLGSTSMLQRKLRIGFARAGRLMDELEQRGVVGPSEGSKARDVLMAVEELDTLQEGRV
ncbi:MAG: DNA translocase FtsK [Actinobacteria bacterium]|nr:DNA translocase FtsK [Actinomycetota bacterium]